MIQQGNIVWIDLDAPTGSEPGYCRPHVVIQNNLMNRSPINTVIVCALTTNLRRAKAPGNVLLELGETDLPDQSVVNVSQIFTIDKRHIGERIGRLGDFSKSLYRVGCC